MVDSDRSEPDLSMKPSEFQISLSIKSYEKKTVEIFRNYYDAEKRIMSKLSKISIPNFDYTNSRL